MKNRYRVEINLNPGESITKLGQYNLGQNGNWITYIVFEQDVDSFEFGFAVSYKSITAIADDYKNQSTLSNPANIEFNSAENGGITVNESYLNQRLGHFLVAPTASEINLPDGVQVEKWQIIINGETYDIPAAISDWKAMLVPTNGILKAVLKENANG